MRAALALLPLTAPALLAQAPPGYYAPVDTSSAAQLRATLHAVVDDHVRIPYTGTATDTWDVLEAAARDPLDPTRVVDVYRNAAFVRGADRVTGYDREHAWPKSYGFPLDAPDNLPFTDCHALFLCDSTYNQARSNLPFDACASACGELPTLPHGGAGGGSGSYPGNSNWTTGGAGAAGHFEVWRGRRGDVARALLYLDVRYEGGTHGGTGAPEPDLVLTDDAARIAASQTGRNERIAWMGRLTTLLRWHAEDPVDAGELRRNDVVFAAQGNRNPFVDHPEWVALLWGGGVQGTFTTFGTGCAGASGFVPAISLAGEPRRATTPTLLCAGAPAVRPAVLNLDVLPRAVDLAALGLPGCTALALPTLSVATATNGFGTAALPLPIPDDPALVGQHVFAQWVALDPAGRGAALSDGGDLRIGGP